MLGYYCFWFIIFNKEIYPFYSKILMVFYYLLTTSTVNAIKHKLIHNSLSILFNYILILNKNLKFINSYWLNMEIQGTNKKIGDFLIGKTIG